MHGGKRGTHRDSLAEHSGPQTPAELVGAVHLMCESTDAGFGLPGPSARPAMCPVPLQGQ